MAENKKSFVLYTDILHTVDKMPDDKAGLLFKHILKYVNDLNPISDDLIVNLTFEPIKQTLKRDLIKYTKYIEKQRINGQLGGRPKSEINPNKGLGYLANPTEPKKADSVSVSVIVSDSVSKESVSGAILPNDGNKLPTLNEREKLFGLKCAEYVPTYGKDMIRAFFDYWAACNEGGNKMHFEKQKTFDLKKRLATWNRNESKFLNVKKEEPVYKSDLKLMQ